MIWSTLSTRALLRRPRLRRTELARSPFIVDITPLKRQPGKQQAFIVSLAPPDGVVLPTAEIKATKLHLDLQMEIAGDQLITQGTIDADWTGPCRRCLEEQDDTTRIEIREIFQKSPVEGETYFLDEDQVDLEPMLRETVLLNLPIAPLCRVDCPGPEPERFPTTVVTDPDPDEEPAEPPADPRWAALSELTFDED